MTDDDETQRGFIRPDRATLELIDRLTRERDEARAIAEEDQKQRRNACAAVVLAQEWIAERDAKIDALRAEVERLKLAAEEDATRLAAERAATANARDAYQRVVEALERERDEVERLKAKLEEEYEETRVCAKLHLIAADGTRQRFAELHADLARVTAERDEAFAARDLVRNALDNALRERDEAIARAEASEQAAREAMAEAGEWRRLYNDLVESTDEAIARAEKAEALWSRCSETCDRIEAERDEAEALWLRAWDAYAEHGDVTGVLTDAKVLLRARGLLR